MSHCDAGVPVEVKIYLSQKIFQLFSKQVSPCFRTLRLLEGKKIFRLSDQSGSRYRNAIPKAERPLYMLSEKADSLCSDRMERGLELVCLIVMRECQSR